MSVLSDYRHLAWSGAGLSGRSLEDGLAVPNSLLWRPKARYLILFPPQIVDQRFCRFEINCLEPLGKLVINSREQPTRLFGPSLIAP